MNIHENVATQALTTFFYQEPLWKKEILYNFLLSPFKLKLQDIEKVITQDNLKETIPDFTIITKDGREIRYEVKINDAALTFSEKDKNNRDAYLIRKNYKYYEQIPVSEEKILRWEDLFAAIDKVGASKDFARLDLVREYMREEINTLLLTRHEVAMLYSPKTIISVYSMSEKILGLCKNFLDSNNDSYTYEIKSNKDFENPQQDGNGIGYYFNEVNDPQRYFFIGLSPVVKSEEYCFSIALQINKDITVKKEWYVEKDYAYFPLVKEILSKYDNDEKQQEEFNKNVISVLNSIM
ncbi:MAG: hypothetical protein II223_02740, partial [Treponema sp.]|jgi:hypothetical protein|nr:hypothetical protein [Treponema sp.]MBQ5876856.1 hypothetical protein [Treponema sp.]